MLFFNYTSLTVEAVRDEETHGGYSTTVQPEEMTWGAHSKRTQS